MKLLSYTTFGEEELENQPKTEEGMEIICPHCGLLHKIKYGISCSTGKKVDTLSSYSCPQTGKTYLAGVNGKLVIGIKK